MLNRIVPLLLIAGLAPSSLRAQTDPFVGQWMLSKMSDQMKVTKVGANTYAFDFGGGAEKVVIDGTFQPAYAGTTLSVAPVGAHWKVVRKMGSHTMLVATWTLSKDGNSLNDHFTGFSQSGSPSTVDNVYERKAPGSGFAGTWINTTMRVSPGTALQVRPYGNNGLSFIIPSAGKTLNVTFDGKEARRLSARSLEIIHKTSGKIAYTRQIEVSPDLKTLTMTVHLAGNEAPTVYVFERR